MYAVDGVDGKDKTIMKIKGIKKSYLNMTFDDFSNMRVKGTRSYIQQIKFSPNVSAETVNTYIATISVGITENKRVNIYKNIEGLNIFVDTKPILLI